IWFLVAYICSVPKVERFYLNYCKPKLYITMDVKLIVSVNGKEEVIKLSHNPSERKTKRERFSFPDFAGKIASTYRNGKYIYIDVPEKDQVKDKKQVSRKTETKKTETKEVSKSSVSTEQIKSKLFDDYIEGNITARELKELSKQI